jgi:Transposase IS4
MGYHKEGRHEEHWGENGYLNEFLSLIRFQQIHRYFTLRDRFIEPRKENETFAGKIEPIGSIIKQNCKALWRPSSHLAIHEAMIAYRGRTSYKVKLPNKPIKEGYKVWTLGGTSANGNRFSSSPGQSRVPLASDTWLDSTLASKHDFDGLILVQGSPGYPKSNCQVLYISIYRCSGYVYNWLWQSYIDGSEDILNNGLDVKRVMENVRIQCHSNPLQGPPRLQGLLQRGRRRRELI